TLYSEGQRRFVESFSPYARQFLERLERPPIDELDPVAAGVAVDRRAPIKSSRSTVATMADLEPYLCALLTREAVPVCSKCGELGVLVDPVAAAARATQAHDGAAALITYPVRVRGTEEFLDARESLLSAGYRRLLVRGEARDIDDVKPSEVLVDSSNAVVAARGRRRARTNVEPSATMALGALEVIVDRVRVADSQRR